MSDRVLSLGSVSEVLEEGPTQNHSSLYVDLIQAQIASVFS